MGVFRLNSSASSLTFRSSEIFGPILPILAYDSVEDAIRIMNSKYVRLRLFGLLQWFLISVILPRPTPLANYLFTKQDTTKQQCEWAVILPRAQG